MGLVAVVELPKRIWTKVNASIGVAQISPVGSNPRIVQVNYTIDEMFAGKEGTTVSFQLKSSLRDAIKEFLPLASMVLDGAWNQGPSFAYIHNQFEGEWEYAVEAYAEEGARRRPVSKAFPELPVPPAFLGGPISNTVRVVADDSIAKREVTKLPTPEELEAAFPGLEILYRDVLTDGRTVVVTAQVFGGGLLTLGMPLPEGRHGWEEGWDYPRAETAVLAAMSWDGVGHPMRGWARYRKGAGVTVRRPDGDPARTYIHEEESSPHYLERLKSGEEELRR